MAVTFPLGIIGVGRAGLLPQGNVVKVRVIDIVIVRCDYRDAGDGFPLICLFGRCDTARA